MQGCGYEYRPNIRSELGRLLGGYPGDVPICSLRGCEGLPIAVGMTLNNAPDLGGPESLNLKR